MSTWGLYPLEEVSYPDSDGKPVAESEFQFYPLIYAVAALRRYFQARDDVYVAGNMFLYYEEGNPRAVVAGVTAGGGDPPGGAGGPTAGAAWERLKAQGSRRKMTGDRGQGARRGGDFVWFGLAGAGRGGFHFSAEQVLFHGALGWLLLIPNVAYETLERRLYVPRAVQDFVLLFLALLGGRRLTGR